MKSSQGPASAWTGDGALCAGLFVLAALARMFFLMGTIDRDLPFSIFYYGDSRLYREFALALMRGEPFDHGIPFHPPLLAYLLSAVIGFVGENPFALRACFALAGALTAPLTYLLGRALWGRAVGLTAALLSVFSFGLMVGSVSPNTEAVYIPLLVGQALAAVALAGAAGENGTQRARLLALLSGLLIGFGSLTRAEHLAFLVLVPLSIVIARGLRLKPAALSGGPIDLRTLVILLAVMWACAAIVIAPWTIHNHRSLTRFNAEHPQLAEPLPTLVAVSNYGALNFALANSAEATGGFDPGLIVKESGSDQIELTDARQLALYLHGYRSGLDYLAGHRSEGARLVLNKLRIGLDALSLGFGASDLPGGLTGERRAVDMFAPDNRVFIFVSVLLIGAGCWVSRGLWRRASILWLVVAHKAAICAAFFGYVRLFVQVLPFVFLLEGAAMVALLSMLPSPRARRAVAIAGLVVAAALGVELAARAAGPRNFTASGSSDPANGKLIQDAPLRLAPK